MRGTSPRRTRRQDNMIEPTIHVVGATNDLHRADGVDGPVGGATPGDRRPIWCCRGAVISTWCGHLPHRHEAYNTHAPTAHLWPPRSEATKPGAGSRAQRVSPSPMSLPARRMSLTLTPAPAHAFGVEVTPPPKRPCGDLERLRCPTFLCTACCRYLWRSEVTKLRREGDAAPLHCHTGGQMWRRGRAGTRSALH